MFQTTNSRAVALFKQPNKLYTIYLFIYYYYLFIYVFIDEYLYRIKMLQQYVLYKNINTAVISVCPA